jgi:hypothetical protein
MVSFIPEPTARTRVLIPPGYLPSWEEKEERQSELVQFLSPSQRREGPCEGINSPRLFTPGETKALAKSKVHQ